MSNLTPPDNDDIPQGLFIVTLTILAVTISTFIVYLLGGFQ